jgi:hypothetical protein
VRVGRCQAAEGQSGRIVFFHLWRKKMSKKQKVRSVFKENTYRHTPN